MMDIVEQLREHFKPSKHDRFDKALFEKAADELERYSADIERLREDRDRLLQDIERYREDIQRMRDQMNLIAMPSTMVTEPRMPPWHNVMASTEPPK
jgi:molecular chaperone GrpE (heat shock protein)